VFHGDCKLPSILELDLALSSSEAWRVRCSLQHAGIGRSLFIDNSDSWVLYGGCSLEEETLDTIRVSSSTHSVSRVMTSAPVFLRHFVSNSCVLGCSHQDFFQVLDGGSNTKCQLLCNPKLFEFNPNDAIDVSAQQNQAVSTSNIGSLLKVFAVQSIDRNLTIPKSWFSSIWTHYSEQFAAASKFLANLENLPHVSGATLIESFFNLEHWNGTIHSESGHATFGSWCWVSSSRLSKPITLFSLSRNRIECCSIRLCESRHLEVISTALPNSTTVLARTSYPVPSSQWFHVSVSV
jgi:hypothetical protein